MVGGDNYKLHGAERGAARMRYIIIIHFCMYNKICINGTAMCIDCAV